MDCCDLHAANAKITAKTNEVDLFKSEEGLGTLQVKFL